MQGDELRLRQRFLIASREALANRLAQLNEEFRIEVLRVSEEIAAARHLRGERLEASEDLYTAAKDGREEISRLARQRLTQMAKEESETIKELTYRAVRHPAKGKRLRELLGEIEQVEQRLKGLERSLSQLEELLRKETTQRSAYDGPLPSSSI